MWSGPVSTCKVHERVLVCMISFLFWLFRVAARNGSSHCIGPKKKNRRRCVFFFVFSFFGVLFVCLLVCFFFFLFVCLFVFLIFFAFLSFLTSLLFDYLCSDKCQNLDEYFDKNRQFYQCLRVPLKPATFGGSFPEAIMIANVFTPQKHQIL